MEADPPQSSLEMTVTPSATLRSGDRPGAKDTYLRSSGFLTYRNYEIISVCCPKLLSLVIQQ